ncbi:VWA domain-containing protein [Paenibacillus sp. F411]|nr:MULTISPECIES: VWA domain-containing protein [Paenibacillus]MBO2945958.1 VWA domain-containing protein [Paenibacillus sp. F411]
MKQILLITDGCSNVGESPVMAAAHALQEGITVNVIGVLDYGMIGELGELEIREIAKAGGGLHQVVGTPQLARTMQMMTRKTVVQTIQQAVNQEIRHILGSGDLSTLPPDKRAEVVQVVDELSETSSLQVALLIDASASMKPKLAAVEEAIRDLMLSLKARSGRSRLSVFHFPGRGSGENVVKDVDWTGNLEGVRSLFGRLQMKGATPTGPALLGVIDEFRYGTLEYNQERRELSGQEEGMLGDYVV